MVKKGEDSRKLYRLVALPQHCVPRPHTACPSPPQGVWSKVYESSVVVVLTVALLGLVAWVGYSLWQQGSSQNSECCV